MRSSVETQTIQHLHQFQFFVGHFVAVDSFCTTVTVPVVIAYLMNVVFFWFRHIQDFTNAHDLVGGVVHFQYIHRAMTWNAFFDFLWDIVDTHKRDVLAETAIFFVRFRSESTGHQECLGCVVVILFDVLRYRCLQQRFDVFHFVWVDLGCL